jgi:hypothetical protein
MRTKQLNSQVHCEVVPAEAADANTDCSICLEQATRPVTVAGCKHTFCFACLRHHQKFAPLNLGKQAKCPLCRAELPDVDIGVLERAQLLGSRALATNTSDEAKVRYCDEGLAEVQKILEASPSDERATILRAELLHIQGNHRSGIVALDSVLRRAQEVDGQRGNLSQMEAQIRAAMEHEANGDMDDAEMDALERQMDAMVASAPQNGRIPPAELVNINLKKGEMLEALGEWAEALGVYKAVFATMAGPRDATAVQQRKLLNACSRCLYYTGEYEGAIMMGEGAIDANRYFPGCHDYVARAQLAKGDLQAAIRTRSRAVLFETPWDDENRAVQRAALAELLAQAGHPTQV